MTTAPAPTLTAKLSQIRSLLTSLTPSEENRPLLEKLQAQLQPLLDNSAIEVAELRASPKQLDFQRLFFARQDEHGRRADIFVSLGGNRSGKSYVCGWLCFAKYLRDHARNGDWFWCVGQNLDRSIGGQQQELWKALPRWMFGAEQTWGAKIGFGMHRKIILPTADGGTCLVEFRSADQAPATFEQAKLTGVWCDERIPEEIYNRILPRIIDQDGWILYSDIPEQWWQLERLVNAEPTAGVHSEHFSMYDNAHNLPDGAIDKAAARMTSDERKMRIAGEFMVMAGVVYKEFIDKDHREGGHLIDPFPVPAEWPKWRLIDYGASAPTACGWVAIGPNEAIYIYREYYQRNLSVGANAAAIIAMSNDGDGNPEKYRVTLMDPHAVDPPPITYGAAKTISQQYAEAGITSTGWPFVQTLGEHAMVQRVKFRLENRTVFLFKTCFEFRREFRSWKHALDKDGKPKAADAFENDNNHLLDGLKGFLGTNPSHYAPVARIA